MPKKVHRHVMPPVLNVRFYASPRSGREPVRDWLKEGANDTGLTLDGLSRAASALGCRVKIDLVAA